MPMVSIITPCYNSAAFVQRTVQSVRAQSIGDWEHVVVDDGSNDGSAAIVGALCDIEPRLRLVRQENRGAAGARNAGYRAAQITSKYILFLDADDCLGPHMLDCLAKYLDLHAHVGMVFCGHTLIDANDNVIPPHLWLSRRYLPTAKWVRQLRDDEPETPFESVFVFAGIFPSLALIRRSAYDLTPGWDEQLGSPCEDTDIFLHIAMRSVIHYFPEPLVMYRRHAFQVTANREICAVQERKLHAKWATMPGLTAQQRSRVVRAIRFRDGRLLPHQGICSAAAFLRRGELTQSARYLGGAIRRYRARLA